MPRHSLQRSSLFVVVALSMSVAALARSQIASAGSATRPAAESIARHAISANKHESARAIEELRSMGPEGLRAFLKANSAAIESALKASTDAAQGKASERGLPARTPQNNQVLAALDSICQQKDCYASRLYWYTDLDQAKQAARASRKPILSLRLLGRLDEDLSCANSRFFRITLYANEQVSKLLRERFVLHWQSVRAVPKLTIDFGDGRKMERTLTGNSIHYVLDSEGRLIDALPGLYAPGAFTRELERIASASSALAAIGAGEERNAALRQYHASRLNELENAWLEDVKRARLSVPPSREIPKPAAFGLTPPSAERAAPVGIAKAVSVERPVLRGMSDNPKALDSIASDAGWSRIARLHFQDAALDESTRALMLFKDPSLNRGTTQLAAIYLSNAIAEDTVRNEYVFRARIHSWLAVGETSPDVAALNEKIYAELFLTPSWDAWLGLRSAGAYSGIDDDGVRK